MAKAPAFDKKNLPNMGICVGERALQHYGLPGMKTGDQWEWATVMVMVVMLVMAVITVVTRIILVQGEKTLTKKSSTLRQLKRSQDK